MKHLLTRAYAPQRVPAWQASFVRLASWVRWALVFAIGMLFPFLWAIC